MAKILVADDEALTRRLLEVTLERAGHTISTACNGLEALRCVEEERPQIVLLDVMMPELDGLRVLNRIKTDPLLQSTIVVMLTAKDEPEDLALGLDIGADFYLCKPIDTPSVIALMKRVCETHPDVA